jgi:futalosine hydrolase
VIPLAAAAGSAKEAAGLLLTCCAASTDSRDADARRNRFPQAAAEDMEGFGVALACTLAGVPLQIVRGISNQVGDRNHANWQIEPALTSAADLAKELIQDNWLPSSSPLSETDRHHA